MTDERCATCKHWGSENRKDAALCMSPMLGDDSKTMLFYGRPLPIPRGLSVHREMMSATDGKDCAGFEAM